MNAQVAAGLPGEVLEHGRLHKLGRDALLAQGLHGQFVVPALPAPHLDAAPALDSVVEKTCTRACKRDNCAGNLCTVGHLLAVLALYVAIITGFEVWSTRNFPQFLENSRHFLVDQVLGPCYNSSVATLTAPNGHQVLQKSHTKKWQLRQKTVDQPTNRCYNGHSKQGALDHMELNNAFVRVLNGKTRQGAAIENHVFRLLGHLGKDPHGTYITVDGTGHPDTRNGKARIYVGPTGFEMIDASTGNRAVEANETADAEAERSDAEIGQDLRETFEILGEMTSAVANGVVKGLVVSGPAGVGKSHTVEQELETTLGVSTKLMGAMPKYDIFKGYTSALNLYCMLYRHSEEGSVLVLDDADGALYDEDSLNLLKAVLDTKKVRRVHWGTNTPILEKEGVPTSFEFRGGIIFLTNIKWDNPKSPRIANHLQALMSRVHYLALNIDTLRERIIHIRNIALDTDMLDEYDFTRSEKEELLQWLIDNVNRLHTVDLRTVIKACDLAKALPTNWKSRAAKTLFKSAR